MIQKNLRAFKYIEPLSEEDKFVVEINGVILKMVTVYQSQEGERSIDNILWVKDSEVNFIHYDGSDNLPMPIISNTSP